jgi:type VI secretion system Hcp family effector
MKSKGTFAKLTSLTVVLIALTICPASYAAARNSANPGGDLSPAPAKPVESDQTPSVRIRMQIADLVGPDQAIEFFAYDHRTFVDTSVNLGGGSSGKVQAGPVTVSKRIDCFTPLLYQLHLTGIHLREVTLRWSRVDPNNNLEQLFFSIKLTDVFISEIHTRLPNQYDPALVKLGEIEEVSFSYKKIEVGCAPAR